MSLNHFQRLGKASSTETSELQSSQQEHRQKLGNKQLTTSRALRSGSSSNPTLLLIRLSCFLAISIFVENFTLLINSQQLFNVQPQFGPNQAQQLPQVNFITSPQQPKPPSVRPEESLMLVLPYESFEVNETIVQQQTYLIDNKLFAEAVSSRCFASTILDDPLSVEPSFIIVRRSLEERINATVAPEIILRAGFDPSKRTTILVHGFTQSYPSTTWLRKVRSLFEVNLHLANENLIIMDWGKASQGSYAQVAAKVSAMASFLANFLMKLIELGTDRRSIHVIGHSLGAHLSGFAGKRLRPRIGRITALDPAGPCFGKFFSNSPSDRLSADDAIEVAVYHYDDDFLGLPGQHGQFDVYVNGGSSQPGCKDNLNAYLSALLTIVLRRNKNLSESHTRSTEVASSKLSTTGCQQVAYECRDYETFKQGECGQCDEQNSQCYLMSLYYQYYAPTAAGWQQNQLKQDPQLNLRTSFPGKRLYISTKAEGSYCSQHYQLLIKFESSPDLVAQFRKNKWRIQLELANELGEQLNITAQNQMAPNVFSSLLLVDSQPRRIVAARLDVRGSDGLPAPIQAAELAPMRPKQVVQQGLVSFRLVALEVNFMSHIDPSVRRSLSSRLCPLEPNAIADSSSLALGALQRSGFAERIQLEECQL